MPILSKLRSHMRRHGDTQINILQHDDDDLTLRSIANIAKEHRTQDEFIIDYQAHTIPTAREATLSEASDELECYETFFNNFKKRERVAQHVDDVKVILQIDAKDKEKSFVPIG